MPDVFYNDNAVPHGSFVAELFRLSTPTNPASGASLGEYKLENFTTTRGSKIIERPNEKGGENGWVGVRTGPTASGTIQIPSSAAADERPDLGDYFEYNTGYRNQGAAAEAERWTISEVGQPFEMDGYFKVTASFKRATFAANVTGTGTVLT